MMKKLEIWLLEHGADPVKTMNELQQHGLVSDNAVWPCEVADADFENAEKFLNTCLDMPVRTTIHSVNRFGH